ncbi:hypothetical protein J2S90_002410 [Arthrobacter bambusae]|jgi:hypothetical protein|uniref:Uncharacterized protein n=1 Tax=Arthrobacter bambusae TaxID=1338426 RepID=A0AAW8DJ28_9MICC|nr:hypothetical protein [Arthrobacter bambusae]MDQ0127479.1 hypothetical protein [Arthrobacter bambusae]MDQ0178821.1 hypothetical protein [Arthrobacter bambusae]MDQ0239623.1 hypothetical protein [Arthrobacter bambusae]
MLGQESSQLTVILRSQALFVPASARFSALARP